MMYDLSESVGLYAFAHRLSTYPYGEARYAPRLHVQAYHMSRGKKVHIQPCDDEIIRMRIPKEYMLADTKRFIAENEAELFDAMKGILDKQFDITPRLLTYSDVVPFLGKELPIKPVAADENSCIAATVCYLREGLAGVELREAILELFAGLAYSILKPKIDCYASRMGLPYSSLEIDDGRRTFGSFNGITKGIFLSRRLVMLCEPVIDFLIVHELAHGMVEAHGEKHDAVMEQVLPDFDELDYVFNMSVNRLIERGWVKGLYDDNQNTDVKMVFLTVQIAILHHHGQTEKQVSWHF